MLEDRTDVGPHRDSEAGKSVQVLDHRKLILVLQTDHRRYRLLEEWIQSYHRSFLVHRSLIGGELSAMTNPLWAVCSLR